MKKTVALFLILCVCMTFVWTACSAQSGTAAADGPQIGSSAETQENEPQDPAGNAGTDTSAPVAASDPGAAEKDDTPAEETAGKVLVAYFSCTRNTAGIAGQIANILGADVYEIVPEEPYTDADLNYNDSSSRTSVEMNDSTSRPAISGSVENLEDYSVIFIGYPIWWGQAPHIVYTFFESYDFSGKTIVPFCTSGSSGVGSSATNLQAAVSDSTLWLDGTRFSASASQSELEAWLDSLDLDIFEN